MRLLTATLVLVAAGAGCTTHVVRPSRTPTADVQFRLASLPRVWVAGFVTEKNPEIDLNSETVRLVRGRLRSWSSAPGVEVEPLALDTEQRFADVPFWRQLGEEHGDPVIVTGSVKLHVAPARVVHRGPRSAYVYSTGRVLEATVVIIDGRTGIVQSTRALPSRMRYGSGPSAFGLPLYLEMMDLAMGDWLNVIARASQSP